MVWRNQAILRSFSHMEGIKGLIGRVKKEDNFRENYDFHFPLPKPTKRRLFTVSFVGKTPPTLPFSSIPLIFPKDSVHPLSPCLLEAFLDLQFSAQNRQSFPCLGLMSSQCALRCSCILFFTCIHSQTTAYAKLVV